MSFLKKVLLTTLFITPVISQAQTVTQGNLNTWFLVLNRFYLSDKFTITNEIHERTGNILSEQGTLILRPSIDYALNENVELSVGYSFVRSWPYAPYTQPIPRNEHNIWEQAFLRSKVGVVNIQHRFRFEHRFVDDIKSVNSITGPEYYIDGTNFANRFRYRLIIGFDLLKVNNGKHAIFVNAFDELWINQADNLIFTSYARNWIYTGLGYRFNSECNIQLGHMRQNDNTGNNTFVSSSIIQLSFFQNFKLYGKKGQQ